MDVSQLTLSGSQTSSHTNCLQSHQRASSEMSSFSYSMSDRQTNLGRNILGPQSPASWHHNQENFSPEVASASVYRPSKRQRIPAPEEDGSYSAFSAQASSASQTLNEPAIDPAIVAQIAAQFELDESRRMLFFSFHAATAGMEKGDAMTRLLAFAQQLETAQLVRQLEAGFAALVVKMETISTTQKQNVVLTETQNNYITSLARAACMDPSRTAFRDMYIDVLAQYKSRAIEEKWHPDIAFAGPKNKITSVIKTNCNAAREFVRRQITSSVLNSGPSRSALRSFVATLLSKCTPEQTSPSLDVVRRIALMRLFAITKKKAAGNEVPASIELDLNHAEAEDLDLHDEETVVGSRSNKKGSSTKANEKMQDAFWAGFEEFLKTKQKEAARRAGGWTLFLDEIVRRDEEEFNPQVRSEALVSPSTIPGESTAETARIVQGLFTCPPPRTPLAQPQLSRSGTPAYPHAYSPRSLPR